MNWLAVDAFPVGGAFVVAERVEEGFAEGGAGGDRAVGVIVGVRGRGRGAV